MLNRLVRIIEKEFLTVLQDKLTLAQLVLMPIIMLFVFSFAITMEVRDKRLAIVCEDDGELGARFVRLFEPSYVWSEIIRFDDMASASGALDRQEVLMILRVPRTFSSDIMSGRTAQVMTMLDGRKSNAAQIANGYAIMTAVRFSEELANAAGRELALPSIETRTLYNPNREHLWFSQPVLMVLLTQMMVLLITGMSVAKERELGTFEQLLVSPLSPLEIVAGKIVPGIVLGLAEGGFMFLMATQIFGVPFIGSLALLVSMMTLFIISTCAIGLAISSLCSTQQQAFLGNCLFMVPSVILSGFVSPFENMPVVFQSVSMLNPTMHTIKAVMGIYLKDLTLVDLADEAAWMIVTSVALIAAAAWFFKSKTQ